MSESDKPDIVERLRKNAEQMYVNELRSDAADAGIYRSWKNTATEAAAEIERLRALTSRSDVLEEAARVAERAHLVPPDGGSPTENERAVAEAAAAAIRALKKDTDNG